MVPIARSRAALLVSPAAKLHRPLRPLLRPLFFLFGIKAPLWPIQRVLQRESKRSLIQPVAVRAIRDHEQARQRDQNAYRRCFCSASWSIHFTPSLPASAISQAAPAPASPPAGRGDARLITYVASSAIAVLPHPFVDSRPRHPVGQRQSGFACGRPATVIALSLFQFGTFSHLGCSAVATLNLNFVFELLRPPRQKTLSRTTLVLHTERRSDFGSNV